MTLDAYTARITMSAVCESADKKVTPDGPVYKVQSSTPFDAPSNNYLSLEIVILKEWVKWKVISVKLHMRWGMNVGHEWSTGNFTNNIVAVGIKVDALLSQELRDYSQWALSLKTSQKIYLLCAKHYSSISQWLVLKLALVEQCFENISCLTLSTFSNIRSQIGQRSYQALGQNCQKMPMLNH